MIKSTLLLKNLIYSSKCIWYMSRLKSRKSDFSRFVQKMKNIHFGQLTHFYALLEFSEQQFVIKPPYKGVYRCFGENWDLTPKSNFWGQTSIQPEHQKLTQKSIFSKRHENMLLGLFYCLLIDFDGQKYPRAHFGSFL